MIPELRIDEMSSPLGPLLLVFQGEALCALDFEGFGPRMERLLAERFGEVRLARGAAPRDPIARVQSYFEGELEGTAGIPLALGGTPFQGRVWAALREIPPGRTLTYGALAAKLGQPGASRAVGLASSQNPVAIVVPCHRLVGAGGKLTGYAGGLERKRWLLGHEAARSFALTPPAR